MNEQDSRTQDELLPLDIGGVDFAEHSKVSRAKKVIPGPLFVPKHATDPRTIDPLVGSGAAGSITMVRSKAYRAISDGSFFYRMSDGVSAASTSDIYVPKDTPIVVASRGYDTFTWAGATGTFVQLTEVR